LTIGTIQISRESTMFRIRASPGVVRRQLAQQVERHLDREVLARVLVGGEHHLRLGLVGRDVVGHLERIDRAALV
jgi:uncharacterized protein (UPF0218 family)